jgi:hypothetical protein
MAATTAVVGSSPISFTNSNGEQQVIPLTALAFNGSQLQLKDDWKPPNTNITNSDQTILLALAQARVAVGELTPPPAPAPAPALAFTAAHIGPETNGITVTSAIAKQGDSPLTTTFAVTATETDTWSGLDSGDIAAQTIGVDTPPTKQGDPPAGTGLIVVVNTSLGASSKIPAKASSGTLKKATPVDLTDADGKVVCAIAPRADYDGTGGLSYAVTIDPSGTTFTVTATYDSSKETGTQNPVTVLTLSSLPKQAAYLVTASAPATGALVPADKSSVQLSGGAPGLAAKGLLYT